MANTEFYIAPNVRNTDPDTSHAAAAEHKILRKGDRVMTLIMHYYHPDGLTDYELGDLIGRQQNSAGKRRGELRDNGLIENSGHKRPAPSGSLVIVWQITPKGIALAKQWLNSLAIPPIKPPKVDYGLFGKLDAVVQDHRTRR